MPLQTARWYPSTAPQIVAYQLLYSDEGLDGPYLTLGAQILNVQSGSNWDADLGAFFVTDEEVPYRFYRVNTVDTAGRVFGDSAPSPFGPNNDPFVLPVPHTASVDHNTGGTDALQYVDPNGEPISAATVRVYRKSDWDNKLYSKVVGITKTDTNGRWVKPIFVEPGNDFIVRYELQYQFGPDTVQITM